MSINTVHDLKLSNDITDNKCKEFNDRKDTSQAEQACSQRKVN